MAQPSAGYSGTPLVKKLGIKEGSRVAVVSPPYGFAAMLAKLAPDAAVQNGLEGKDLLDVILLFVDRRAAFERQLPSARRRMAPAAGLWIAWPKKSSGIPTDMHEGVIRTVALPTGLVDNKVCAIDDVWSGLRLVIRVENRKKL